MRYGILGFLNYGSMTGYDISKAFSESIDFFWHAQTSQIYRELAKLEKENMVDHIMIIQTDKPNKKEYTITQKGKEDWMKWLASPPTGALGDFKSEFLMKVFFSGALTVQDSIERLDLFKMDCLQYAQKLTTTAKSIEAYANIVQNPLDELHWALSANFGKQYIITCIKWAEESIEILTEKQEESK